MSITPLSAARIAGELGLAGGTITGGAYAAKYSGQVNTIAKTKDKEIQQVKVEKQNYFDTRGELRTKANNMVVQFQNVKTYWGAYKNSFPSVSLKSDLNAAIEAADQASAAFSTLSQKYNT